MHALLGDLFEVLGWGRARAATLARALAHHVLERDAGRALVARVAHSRPKHLDVGPGEMAAASTQARQHARERHLRLVLTAGLGELEEVEARPQRGMEDARIDARRLLHRWQLEEVAHTVCRKGRAIT